MMSNGKIIKQLRLNHNMTQENLAKRLHTTKQTIYKYENNIITNIPSDKIKAMSEIFDVSPIELLGLSKVDIPGAHAVPILSKICAGDGILCDQNYEGNFYVDNSIKADCCLRVKGDSMKEADIHEGDYAFIVQDYEFEEGNIYAVRIKSEDAATLKKVYRVDGKVILQPCNSSCKPLVEDPNNVQIIGELTGVYHAKRK